MEEPRRGHNAVMAREAILNAAEDVFAAAGFSGARVDKIAESSGYNKNLIFHYFSNKLGLYHAVLARVRDVIEEELGELLDLPPVADADNVPLSHDQVRSLIESTVRWAFDFYRRRPKNVRMLVWEAAEGWQAFRACKGVCADGEPQHWANRLDAVLRQAQRQGIIRTALDPRLLIINVMNLTLMYHASTARFQGVFPTTDLTSTSALDYARDQIVALVLNGALQPLEESSHAAVL